MMTIMMMMVIMMMMKINFFCAMMVIKNKAQKASIKEGLLPIAWHPSRWWDWCMTEDEKSDAETFWQ